MGIATTTGTATAATAAGEGEGEGVEEIGWGDCDFTVVEVATDSAVTTGLGGSGT